VFTYRIYDENCDELGKAAYTQHIKPGELIRLSGAREACVTRVVDTPLTERQEGLLIARLR
jgi:hypothetical protein